MRTLFLTLITWVFVLPAQAQYSGGSGTADDPYQIATAADLIALGETADDYDKHFILTADIDLDPNLLGGKVFDRAVIAPDNDRKSGYLGRPFTGVFDGDGHTISHLTIVGGALVGLFGELDSGGTISNLGLEAVDVKGSVAFAGGLVGFSDGDIRNCYSTGEVSGVDNVGGLVGSAYPNSRITLSYTRGSVDGDDDVGGLVGENNGGTITGSHSNAAVNGRAGVGGLVGGNSGSITMSHGANVVIGNESVGGLVGRNTWGDGYASISACHSNGAVTGYRRVGGLVGANIGLASGGFIFPVTISNSYSTSAVSGGESVGGLVGTNGGDDPYDGPGEIIDCYSTGVVTGDENVGGLVGTNVFSDVIQCFWDAETSGQTQSVGGTGLSTARMQSTATFLEAGWDFIDETENGTDDVWKIVEGHTYPLLSWQKYGGGTGEPNDPYLIYTAEHLNALGAEPNDYDKHFKLMADIDLLGYVYDRAAIAPDTNDVEDGFQGTAFTGLFDGNGQVISNLTIMGGNSVGLFGWLSSEAEAMDLGVKDVSITGYHDTGGLAGRSSATLTRCYTTGTVSGDLAFGGGLVGAVEGGLISGCYSTCEVNGVGEYPYVGGLVGCNGCPGSLLGGTGVLVTISKGSSDTDGDTRAGHNTVESGPGNCMTSSRNEPESHDTCSSTPVSAPPPTGGRDDACDSSRRASPRRSAECVQRTVRPPRRRVLWDCHSPYPGTGAGTHRPSVPADPPRSPQWFVSAVCCRARWRPPRPRPAVRHRPRRSHCVWCRFSHDPWDSDRHGPPKTRLAHRAIGALPSPVDSAQFFAVLDQRGPDSFQDALVDPPLEGAMNGRIVAELPGQVVPLAAAAHLIDDAVERRPRVDTRAPRLTGWIPLVQNGLNDTPQFVADLPNGGKRLDLAFLSGHP